MRVLVQRVARAAVRVEGATVGEIGPGLLVLLGVHRDDTPAEVEWLAEKILQLRLFEGPGGHFDRSLAEVDGAVLVVSQFTLYGDARKGRRPDFGAAADPARAEPLYEAFIARLRAAGRPVACGVFGAMMAVELVNDGPVTVLLERPAPPAVTA